MNQIVKLLTHLPEFFSATSVTPIRAGPNLLIFGTKMLEFLIYAFQTVRRTHSF